MLSGVKSRAQGKNAAGFKLVRKTMGGESYEYYPLGRYVVMAPGVCGGRPTFKGTRVEVQTVLDWLRSGRTVRDIAESYPSVSQAAIREAVQLASRAFIEHLPRLAA
jgi:uncharacterized protein (DUF433 family)